MSSYYVNHDYGASGSALIGPWVVLADAEGYAEGVIRGQKLKLGRKWKKATESDGELRAWVEKSTGERMAVIMK